MHTLCWDPFSLPLSCLVNERKRKHSSSMHNASDKCLYFFSYGVLQDSPPPQPACSKGNLMSLQSATISTANRQLHISAQCASTFCVMLKWEVQYFWCNLLLWNCDCRNLDSFLAVLERYFCCKLAGRG